MARVVKNGHDLRVRQAAVLAKLLVVGENGPMIAASDLVFVVDEGERPAIPSVPAGRSKTFRPYDPTQQFLVPPSLDDRLPQDHDARFVAEAVEELLDLDPIYASHTLSDALPPAGTRAEGPV